MKNPVKNLSGLKSDRSSMIRLLLGGLLLAAALVSLLSGLLRPVGGDLARICQLLRCGMRALLLGAAGLLVLCPRMKREDQFLLLGIALGLLYSIMILPWSVPDESFHYSCTLGLVSRLFYGQPMADAALLSQTDLIANNNTPQTLLAMIKGLSAEGLTGELVTFAPEITAYPPQYLPQMLAFALCLALKLNRWWFCLLGGLANLAFYLLVTRQAVKLLPKGKMALMLIALLPMSLQQAGSLSPDGFINSMSFLLIALVLHLARETRPMTIRQILPLTLLALALAPAKGIYTLMSLLVMVIPGSRFGGERRKWLYTGLLLLCGIGLLFIFEMNWMNGLEAQGEAVGGYYTITWCLTHPLQAMKVVLNSFLHPFSGAYGSPNLFWWLESGAGILLSTFTLLMPMCTIYPMLFLILQSVLITDPADREAYAPWQRIWFLITSFMVILAAFGIMMISWTPMGAELIEGVQGRYFLPVFPLLFLCLRTGRIRTEGNLSLAYLLGFAALHYLCFQEIINIFLALGV